MARVADSKTVEAKAAALPVKWAGMGPGGVGRFTVASGSEPGKTYTVEVADPRDADRPALFGCNCEWAANGGRACSHARATSRYLTDATAKRERAAARAARQTAAAVLA